MVDERENDMDASLCACEIIFNDLSSLEGVAPSGPFMKTRPILLILNLSKLLLLCSLVLKVKIPPKLPSAVVAFLE